MKKRSELKNVSASVRARLLKISKASGQDFNLLLVRYCIERLLYRLSMSEHNVRFVLKGALLFSVWHPIPHRVTRDLDLLGFGSREVQDLVAVFRDVCSVAVEDDGIVFDVESIAGESIRAEELYAGIRITLLAMIGAARLHVQVDVGFGDSVAVQPVEIAFPSLLDMPTPLLRAYRMETSVAEKFDAILTRGLLNTRMKDYFDLWFLAKNFAFDGALLAKSLKATCGRRAIR